MSIVRKCATAARETALAAAALLIVLGTGLLLGSDNDTARQNPLAAEVSTVATTDDTHW